MNHRDQVLKTAAELVSAFARNDREAYFSAFSTDASFVFHTQCPVSQIRSFLTSGCCRQARRRDES